MNTQPTKDKMKKTTTKRKYTKKAKTWGKGWRRAKPLGKQINAMRDALIDTGLYSPATSDTVTLWMLEQVEEKEAEIAILKNWIAKRAK